MSLMLYFTIIQSLIFWNENVFSNALIGNDVREAEENEFPFIVSLGDLFYNDGCENHFCGGTLISKKHILTAAHCIVNKKYDQITITLGSNDLQNGETMFLKSMISYADWAKKEGIHRNIPADDVAILTLFIEVDNPDVTVISLSEIQDFKYYGKPVKTAGWGSYRSNIPEESIIQPRLLKAVNLEVITRDLCKENIRKYKNDQKTIIPPQWLCTNTYPSAILGPGDSGGPLVFKDNEEKITLIAVNAATSPQSTDLENTAVQNVYISIESVKDFIDAILNGDNDDDDSVSH